MSTRPRTLAPVVALASIAVVLVATLLIARGDDRGADASTATLHHEDHGGGTPEEQDRSQDGATGPRRPTEEQVSDWVLSSVLAGRFEIDDRGRRLAPNSPAKGSAVLQIMDPANVCVGLAVKGLSEGDEVHHVHLHRGRANENGPSVAQLALRMRSGAQRATSACMEVDPVLVAAVRSDPQAYYLNVHTTAEPKGALRGQLHPTRYVRPAP